MSATVEPRPKKRDRIVQVVTGARGQGGALLYALGESGDIYTLDDRFENARWTRVRVSPLLRKRPASPTPEMIAAQVWAIEFPQESFAKVAALANPGEMVPVRALLAMREGPVSAADLLWAQRLIERVHESSSAKSAVEGPHGEGG